MCVLLTALTLSGCIDLFGDSHSAHHKKHARHIKPANTTDDANAYLLHLTLAKLALEETPPDVKDAEPHLDGVEAYSPPQEIAAVPGVLPVIIIDYSVDGQKKRIAAPFIMPHQNSQFPSLLKVMHALGHRAYTLQDIHPGIAKITATEATELPRDDTEAARKIMDKKLGAMLDKPSGLAPIEEVRIDLLLIRFFMANHFKEAAYLLVENAKQALPQVSEESVASKDAAQKLSAELEALEGQLHKAMPFSLAF